MKPASFSEKPLPPILYVASATAEQLVKTKRNVDKKSSVHDSEVDT